MAQHKYTSSRGESLTLTLKIYVSPALGPCGPSRDIRVKTSLNTAAKMVIIHDPLSPMKFDAFHHAVAQRSDVSVSTRCLFHPTKSVSSAPYQISTIECCSCAHAFKTGGSPITFPTSISFRALRADGLNVNARAFRTGGSDISTPASNTALLRVLGRVGAATASPIMANATGWRRVKKRIVDREYLRHSEQMLELMNLWSIPEFLDRFFRFSRYLLRFGEVRMVDSG